MRIAICLSGLVRTYRQTFENFYNSILVPNPQHQFDVFISTWPTEHSNNSMERTRRIAWSGGQAPPFPEESIDYPDIQSKYRPMMMLVEGPREFPVPWTTTEINIQSFMCMLFKIWSADYLRRQHEHITGQQYDLVIRSRFDTLLPFELKIDDTFDGTVMHVPSMMQEVPYPELGWCNDKFAIGNGTLMSIYTDWYWNMNRLAAKGVPIQPETLLKAHLDEYHVRTKEWGCEMELVRAF